MTVDTITGEVYLQGLTPFEARALTDEIRQTLTLGHDLLIRAFTGRAWTALGYETWDAYCAGEFSDARMVRLDREQRREIVAEMREAGMSSRAIASGLGVPKSTVISDAASTDQNGSVAEPTPITGVNGKTYQPPAPKPEAPAVFSGAGMTPRTDVDGEIRRALARARDAAAAADLIKKQHLTSRSEEAAVWSRDLFNSMQSLQRLLDALQEASA